MTGHTEEAYPKDFVVQMSKDWLRRKDFILVDGLLFPAVEAIQEEMAYIRGNLEEALMIYNANGAKFASAREMVNQFKQDLKG